MSGPDALCRMVVEHTGGRRVAVLGCGTGRDAIALAQAGFAVHALDASSSAIDAARQTAEQIGASVRWQVSDLGAHRDWPLGVVDVVVCAYRPGSGRDVDLRRMLHKVRQHLAAGGVLVLDQTTPDDAERLTWDAVTGRLGNGVRLHHPPELVRLVRSSGFAPERIETGTVPSGGRPPDTRVVARALPVPPNSLASTAWGEPTDNVRLDLRYADDEAQWLDPQPAAVWAELVATEAGGVDLIEHYPVDDPYGGTRAAPVLNSRFGCRLSADQITFGAGVTSLLRALGGLANEGTILAPALVHPDLEAWAVARGDDVRLVPEPATGLSLIQEVRETRPSLVHLDRPTFTGWIPTGHELRELARAAWAYGAPVVLDESAASYLRPAGSALTLVAELDNLVVLRGFTKAYSWGGLRAGFAVCSEPLADRVRELVTPMQVGGLALAGALRLLAAGGGFGRLRARVRVVKPEFVAALRAAGLQPEPGHPDLPWVTVANPEGQADRLLAAHGIRALHPVSAPVGAPACVMPIRLTVPLTDRRRSLFTQLIAERPTVARPTVARPTVARPNAVELAL